MATVIITESKTAARFEDASPLLKARVAGASYLITTVCGVFALLAEGKLVVSGNAVATAHNIMASQPLYRLGFAADLIASAAYIVVTLLLYDLLKPVSRSLSLLAAFFSLVGISIGAVASLGLLAPLLLLGGAQYLTVYNTGQLEALALLSIKLYGQGYYISLVFFGFYCVSIGYLIFKSTFLPRTVGVLVAIAGLGWLTNSFTIFLSPALANYLDSIIPILGLVGEGSLMLWLLIVGVNVVKWEEKWVTS